MRAAFVYPNPRRELVEAAAAGRAPDTGLLGQNHLSSLGVDAVVHEPGARRHERVGGLRHRLSWNARELVLPWELRDADVAVTPLANAFPLAARLRGRPRVVVLNYGLVTTWERASPPRRRLLLLALRAADAVACLAASQRERLLALAGLDPERVRVVHFGVDAEFFRAAPVPADGHVLAVGKDLARDYATLARACAGLGRHVEVVALPRNLDGVDLPRDVRVRERVDWSELREAYRGAACVVLPLRRPDYPYGTEASGLTALLEAMASARPVVLTERAAFADYAMPGETCLAVPPEDPSALRTALERILADGALAARLGERARARVEERFSSLHLAQRLASLLREVATP